MNSSCAFESAPTGAELNILNLDHVFPLIDYES